MIKILKYFTKYGRIVTIDTWGTLKEIPDVQFKLLELDAARISTPIHYHHHTQQIFEYLQTLITFLDSAKENSTTVMKIMGLIDNVPQTKDIKINSQVAALMHNVLLEIGFDLDRIVDFRVKKEDREVICGILDRFFNETLQAYLQKTI
jgi:hypothetical protein